MTLTTHRLFRMLACVVAVGSSSAAFAQAPGDSGKPVVAIVDGGHGSVVPAPNLTLFQGNLGIGTDNPTHKLEVNGQVNATGLCMGGGCMTNWNQVGGGSNGPWLLSGTNAYYNGGSVGIGTASPGAKLHIASGSVRVDDNSRFEFGGTANALLGSNASNFLQFNTNNTERLRIDASGRVGIGTASPTYRLHVNGFTAINSNANYAILAMQRDFTTKAQILADNDGATGGNLVFYTQADSANNTGALTPRIAVVTSGNVGIGTTGPTERLHVIGNIAATGSISAYYQDVAEWVDTAEPLAPGTVVITDDTAVNRVRRSNSAYDTSVAGVVSAQPGVLLGQAGEGRAAVAQSGRVKVKVDASYGAIKPGDVLVTSPREGYAMKSKPVMVGDVPMHRPGSILGKALEPLPSGEGEILVLITLQ